MKLWSSGCASLALLAGMAAGARAQVGPPTAPSTAPAAAGPVTPTAPAAGAPAAAGGQRNLWSFLCPSPEQKAACKDSFCNSQFGQLFNNSLKPASALTGGVIPTCCPPVTAADLAKPPDSAEGAAAKIKQDEAGAKARRAAVRYLGTVDCNYWPEARDGLINALRADRNECVRLEAALALSRGCCCSKETIKALTLTVSGSREDGNPAESSERVKWAAAGALEYCLACFVEVQPVPPAPPTKPPAPPPETPPPPPETGPPAPPPGASATSVKPVGYYARVAQAPLPQVLQEARHALQRSAVAVPSSAMGATPASSARGQGLVNMVMDVVSERTAPPASGAPPAHTPEPAVVPAEGTAAPKEGPHVSPAPAAAPPAPRPPRRGLIPLLRDAIPARERAVIVEPPPGPRPGAPTVPAGSGAYAPRSGYQTLPRPMAAPAGRGRTSGP